MAQGTSESAVESKGALDRRAVPEARLSALRRACIFSCSAIGAARDAARHGITNFKLPISHFKKISAELSRHGESLLTSVGNAVILKANTIWFAPARRLASPAAGGVAGCSSGLFSSWANDRRGEKFHRRHRQAAGEVIVVRLASLHVGGDHAEVALADVKNKGRGAVGRARSDDGAGAVEGFEAVVAGAGLAADGDDFGRRIV